MWLISDEIYHGLEFGAPAVSALELTDDAIVINSLSKYHAMTGWRVGWMVLPEALVRPVQTLAQNLFICPSHAGQIAALGALSEEGEAEVAAHLARYRENRATVLDGLAALGFSDIAPADGAFYAYAGLADLPGDSTAFCRALLRAEGVATTPGLDFDPERGHRTLRLSFAQSPERIREGMDRLARFLRAGCPGLSG
jgi:aspartate/methionine/tyrosine aminotransferase